MSEDNRRNVVIVDDTRLVAMTKDERVLAAFPFLRSNVAVAAGGAGCDSCQQTKDPNTLELNRLKGQLASITPEQKATLLRLLNARQVSIHYMDGPTARTTTHAADD